MLELSREQSGVAALVFGFAPDARRPLYRLSSRAPEGSEAKMSCADCHDPHGGTAGNNLRVVRTFAPLTAEEKTALVAKTANVKGPQLEYY